MALFIEMSRNEVHGGGTWAFTRRIWAPTKTKANRKWMFWSKILQVKKGDIIFHLRGVPPEANFVGYSFAAEGGRETDQRPPDAQEWSFSSNYYCCDLEQFIPLQSPINLNEIFLSRRTQLEGFFQTNRNRKGASKLNLFYVLQNKKLQCLNGAYLSDLDEELFRRLFGEGAPLSPGAAPIISVETGSQLRTVLARIGQDKFSKAVKDAYGWHCCFPGCLISDPRFLIGSHIARWTDDEERRGYVGNGLCLCVMHDRAFELGLFTLDSTYRIFVNPGEMDRKSSIIEELRSSVGKQIKLAKVAPLPEALRQHWIRVKVKPPN